MVDSGPLVSIIIPTYKREEVKNAVESALSQTHSNIEVIVVDDSGEGLAQQWLKDYSGIDLYCLDANRGANHAREFGFENASGEYIHFLDDDDTISSEKIERSLDLFRSDSSVSVVYSGVEFRDQDFYPDQEGDVLKDALKFEMWPCMTSSMLIDRQAIEETNIFRRLPGGDDLQMMIELAKYGKFRYISDSLVNKGDPPNSRGGSAGAFEGKYEILEMYAELYQSYPQSVYATAKSKTEFQRAKYYLRKSRWSLTGIHSMVRHCYWNPNKEFSCLLKILASLFGRPGWKFANWAYDNAGGAE